MGYESRLYIVDRREFKDPVSDKVFMIYGSKIATFDMACVGWRHEEVFTEPIDFSIDYDKDEKPVDTDCYGEHCCSASVQRVIEVVEALEENDHYRRFKPLLGFLRGLDESEWDDLRVVHFGY